jgi:hypothetical protein
LSEATPPDTFGLLAALSWRLTLSIRNPIIALIAVYLVSWAGNLHA